GDERRIAAGAQRLGQLVLAAPVFVRFGSGTWPCERGIAAGGRRLLGRAWFHRRQRVALLVTGADDERAEKADRQMSVARRPPRGRCAGHRRAPVLAASSARAVAAPRRRSV